MTHYTYDSSNRITRMTLPEGNYEQYAYDARGNVTSTTWVAKPGSGLSNIVVSAAYPSSCANPVTCNLPTSTTDARGNVTDYTYDANHGGVLSVTLPDPDGAGAAVRPQTRYAYSALSAYYKNSSGTIVQAPSPVYRLASVSACATAASCSGGADETLSSISYGSTGVANNLVPVASSAGAGDGSLTATSHFAYDHVRNLIEVQGPLAGSADLTRFRYNGLRQRVGVIGPGPDGAGALAHRASRISYNDWGLVSSIERGMVASQSDADWAAFTPLEQLNIAYDGAGRRIRGSFVAGGATHAVTQYSYDGDNRLECVAVRMNAAVFGSLPSSACTLGTEGAHGPDRITRYSYDAVDRMIQTMSAYGTSSEQASLTQTWTWNGLIGSVEDANDNVTTYEYDGFDRVRRIYFPPGVSDYEQYTYDAASNVTQDRRRDGATITYAFDNLNRATAMTPSSGAAVSYGYDIFSRLTGAAFTGHTLGFAYDQLSRNTSASGPLGAVSYQYDIAGRRTRVTWPDAFYAAYDYDLTNAVTAIRENGATSGIGVLATYAYDNLGRRTSVTRGNGVSDWRQGIQTR